MDKTWLGKDPSIASSPVVSTFPGDVHLHHVTQERLSWLQIKQSKDLTQSSHSHCKYPNLWVILSPLPQEMGFLWSQNQSNRSNCAQQIDPSQGGVLDHKHEPWSPTSYRNILSTRLWHAVSWTCLLTCSFFNKQPYFHFDETKTLKQPHFS